MGLHEHEGKRVPFPHADDFLLNPHRLSLDITEKHENIRRLRYKRDIVVVLPFGIRSFQVCCLQSMLHSIKHSGVEIEQDAYPGFPGRRSSKNPRAIIEVGNSID